MVQLAEDVRPLFYGGPDPIVLNRMEKMVQQLAQMEANKNRLTSNALPGGDIAAPWPRSNERGLWYAQDDLDPRRSIDQECGYPGYVAPEGFKALIDREPIAGVCNDLYPEESWVGWPTVYDADREMVVSEFEQGWANLPQQMDIEPSYYGDEQGNAIYDKLLLADKLAGYGRYGAVLLQFDDDTEDLSQPVLPRTGRRLVNIRPFPEHLARISMFDMGMTSRRYGFPTKYQVYFSDPQDMSRTGINENYTSRQIHWSRIVHIPDVWHHPSSSQVFAIERLRPVLNPIMDIRKVRAGSAEMYWNGAFPGYHFGTHPSLGPDVDVDRDSITDMYQEYRNSIQRLMVSSGMTIEQLAPQVVDPTAQLMVQYISICVKLRCPMRILMGSERGELSSGDDKVKWNKRLYARQHEFITPRIVVPFVNRLINLGVLPKPAKTGYKVHWPDPSMVSPTEKADVFLKRMQAYGFYVSQGVGQVIPPIEVMTKFDGMDQEEAESILQGLEEPFDAALDREETSAKVDAGRPKIDFTDPENNPLKQSVGRDTHGGMPNIATDAVTASSP